MDPRWWHATFSTICRLSAAAAIAYISATNERHTPGSTQLFAVGFGCWCVAMASLIERRNEAISLAWTIVWALVLVAAFAFGGRLRTHPTDPSDHD
jgi:hypothetical protein